MGGRTRDVSSFEEKKKKDIASFVNRENVVDWQRWNNLTGNDGSYNDELKTGIIEYLLKVGVLSIEKEGNHRTSGQGLNLNPRSHIFETYFTSRDQARSYAKAILSEAQYEVTIEQIVDVETI